jgi:regulator of cell morphogenesis and NO signaling
MPAKGPITKEMIINDVVSKYPKIIAVFNKFKVDACCGGGFSIEKTAKNDGVNVQELLKELNKMASSGK